MNGGGSLLRGGVRGLLDVLIVILFALFLWAPWDRARPDAHVTMAWLALPVMLAHGGAGLAHATNTVTFSALAFGISGTALAVLGRVRGASSILGTGMLLFGACVSILMPVWTAVGFLGALLLVLALQARFAALDPVGVAGAVLLELWPIGYTAAFSALAWRYNPQLLLKALLIALGASLVGRALVPAPRRPVEA